MSDVLGGKVSIMSAGAAPSARSVTHIVLETAESAPEIAFFKVAKVLDLPCE